MSQRTDISKIIFELDYWLALQMLHARKDLPEAEKDLVQKQFAHALREYLGAIPTALLLPPPTINGRIKFAFECHTTWCKAQVTMAIDPKSQLAEGTIQPPCPGCHGPLQVLPRKVQCPICRGYGRICVSDYLDINHVCWKCNGAKEIDRE